ncbi:MAG: GntR family transcriptional regulator [Rubritepida sp.]|nr:GntR family transcriptional regulator [Rubritepida sp.]
MDDSRVLVALGPVGIGPLAVSKFGRLPAGRAPLYQRLADQVQKVIGKLRLMPGTQLPTEDQLARHFAVSMITVRGALRELQQRGLIERRQGRGTFVREPQAPPREWGLGSIDELVATNRLTEVRLLECERVAVPDWASAHLGVPRGDRVLHLRIARYQEDAPVMMTDAFYPEDIGRILAQQPLEPLLKRNPLIVGVAEMLTGERVTDIHQEMSAGRVSAEVARTLFIKRGEPVLVMTRTSRTQQGRLIQVARSYYPTDGAVYTIELKRSQSATR